MAPAVDFGEWAAPGLELTLGGGTYMVPPPTVEDAKKLLAMAVRAEVRLGIVKGEIPDDVEAVLATIPRDEHPALGPVFAQLVDDGVPQPTIDRMAYYSTFYWARGKGYADALARILWEPVEAEEAEAGAAPKG